MTTPHPFRAAIEAGDHDAALDLLHDDVVFRSPVVHHPYQGRAATAHILRHVVEVFEDFRYVDQVVEGDRAVLFFAARVGDRDVEGIDSLTVDAEGRITAFTVMVRPLSGLIPLAQAMQARLEEDPVPS